VARRFSAIPAEVKDVGAHALVGWAAATATDDAAFQSLLLGGVQRRIANFDRLTIMGSSIADPSARGWTRVGFGECDFCRLLLDRGAVYSEDTVDFESHDNCRCSGVPEF
jgi:queuine/archaeosine tRNA-ribosyltransferase